MGRKRTCELPFCKGVVEGTRNKRRCDNDRNIHLHQIISKNVKKIMRYIEGHEDFTANDVNKALFKDRLDKNEKGSMYRLFQAMIRENYIVEQGKRSGLKVYAISEEIKAKKSKAAEAKLANAIDKDETEKVEKVEKLEKTEKPEIAKTIEIQRNPFEAVLKANIKPVQTNVKQNPEEILLGELRDFVFQKKGQWNHFDWTELINKSNVKEFGLSEEDIGRILEEQKTAYWTQRNG